MPSLIELAELCKAVYGDEGLVTIAGSPTKAVWKREKKWEDGNFFAAHYIGPKGDYVLAFRGTDTDILENGSDWQTDNSWITIGGVPPQAAPAILCASQLSNKKPYITGHSLGGALAIISAAQYNLPAVTFNAPTVADSCLAATPATLMLGRGLKALIEAAQRCIANPQIQNIRINADPVSSYWSNSLAGSLPFGGYQPGENQTLTAKQCGFDLLCRHDIDTCVSAVRSRPDAHAELRTSSSSW